MAASSMSNRRQGVEMMKQMHNRPKKLGKKAKGMMKRGRNAGGVRAKS